MKKKTVKARSMPLSVVATSSSKMKLGYEEDFSKWATDQAKLLKRGAFEKLDMENLIEEIEDLSICFIL